MEQEDSHLPSTRLLQLERPSTGSCGFHLTRSKFDPYPWIGRVDSGSAAEAAGMRAGDCLLEVNGEDVLGLKVGDIAERIRAYPEQVTFVIWDSGADSQCDPESLCCGPMPTNLKRLSACMQNILTSMECPICLETVQPPTFQCVNGHLICWRCHGKSERCPICRVRLSRGKSLLADQVYNSLLEAFELNKHQNEEEKTEKLKSIFRLKDKKKNKPDIKITQSHTNKFLARLVEKSSSAENLSNPYLVSKNFLSVKEDFNNLKTKSLSATEIFRPGSPCLSRITRFNRSNGDAKNNISCHGSYECLSKEQVGGEKSQPKNFDALCHCPFAENCKQQIKVDTMTLHFQNAHDGPLVQYFKSKIKFQLLDQHKNTYCLKNERNQAFYLKIHVSADGKDLACRNIHIWTWISDSQEEAKSHQLLLKVHPSQDGDLILLSVNCPIYSLAHVSWADIINYKKGVFFSGKTLNALNTSSSDYLVLDVEINDLSVV